MLPWSGLISVAAQRALAATFLERPLLVTAQARATTHSFDRANLFSGHLSQGIAEASLKEACLMQSLTFWLKPFWLK